MQAGPTNGDAYPVYGEKSDKSLAGLCNQYMSKGACSRGDNCQYVHDLETKGSGEKGRGRGREGKGGKQNPKQEEKPTCFFCGKVGHMKADCYAAIAAAKAEKTASDANASQDTPAKGKGKKGKSKERPTCHNCGKIGHMKDVCYAPGRFRTREKELKEKEEKGQLRHLPENQHVIFG